MAEVAPNRARRKLWLVLLAIVVVFASWAILDADVNLDAQASPPSVVVNEIHYNPAAGGVEFVELHSTHDVPVDVSGYQISGLITLPGGTVIDAGGFLVLTADLALFASLYPGIPALEWDQGASLDDEGQYLILTSSIGETIDVVGYGDGLVEPGYTIDQVIDGTIGAGDGGNPNQPDPMGLHDAPLYLPQGWSWSQGTSRNIEWGTFGTGNALFAEWRCAVMPEFGGVPPVPFRINVRNAAYWQFANGSWTKGFDVNLVGGNRGAYLGDAGVLNTNPYANSSGQIPWRLEADGSFSAPWESGALMMHFWASQRLPALQGQTAELSTSEFRLQQPDGQTVDLSLVNVLFQCGVDYYSTTGGQGTSVPGPGIGKYHWASTSWQPSLWVTLPPDAPAASVQDFGTWLTVNKPPVVYEFEDELVRWPAAASGTGPSLELLDPALDNSLATSWTASSVGGGTPGAHATPRCRGLVVTVDIGVGETPTEGPDVILGTAGADVIDGLGGDDTICGLGGDDTITGGTGNDTILGGPGNDDITQ